MSSTTDVLIFGAGAVGAFYGSRIAQTGTRVSCVCRSNYKAVKENGFSIKSPQYGNYNWVPDRTFASPDEAVKSNVKWRYVIVSTKALPDVNDDSVLLEGLIGQDTAIVLIQNGLGVEEPYRRRFTGATILSAVTIVSAAQPENGVIAHNRWTRIHVGPYLPNDSTLHIHEAAIEHNAAFIKLLNDGGVKDASAYTHAKLQLVRWHKIAINASMNPSSVLSGGSPNAVMARDSELYIHLKGVMDEVLVTAPKVLGTPFPPDFATSEAILDSTRRNASGSRPSMWGDWESDKRMELEVILGNPIRIAREAGLEMPRLQSLYALLRMAQENRDILSKSSKL